MVNCLVIKTCCAAGPTNSAIEVCCTDFGNVSFNCLSWQDGTIPQRSHSRIVSREKYVSSAE